MRVRVNLTDAPHLESTKIYLSRLGEAVFTPSGACIEDFRNRAVKFTCKKFELQCDQSLELSWQKFPTKQKEGCASIGACATERKYTVNLNIGVIKPRRTVSFSDLKELVLLKGVCGSAHRASGANPSNNGHNRHEQRGLYNSNLGPWRRNQAP